MRKPIKPGRIPGTRLTVIGVSHVAKNRGYYYKCRCDCGTEKTIRGERLRNGETKSCGCLKNDRLRVNAEIAYKNNFGDGTSIPKISTQNIQKNNTSGVRGVNWHRRMGKWQVRIMFKKKSYHIGYANNLTQAKKMRREAEMYYFGEYLKNRE